MAKSTRTESCESCILPGVYESAILRSGGWVLNSRAAVQQLAAGIQYSINVRLAEARIRHLLAARLHQILSA